MQDADTPIKEATTSLDKYKTRLRQKRDAWRKAHEILRALDNPTPRPQQTTAERDREELFAGYSPEEIANRIGVDVTTVRRWHRGRPIPPAMRLAVRLTVHGDLGAISREWQGWNVRGGVLNGPDGLSFKPGEVMANWIIRQRIRDLEDELRTARQIALKTLQGDWIENRYVQPEDYSPPQPPEIEEQRRHEDAKIRRELQDHIETLETQRRRHFARGDRR